MFNWLNPLTSILATQNDELDFSEKRKEVSKPLLHTFLHAPPPALLDLVNGLSDDIYAFYKYAGPSLLRICSSDCVPDLG